MALFADISNTTTGVASISQESGLSLERGDSGADDGTFAFDTAGHTPRPPGRRILHRVVILTRIGVGEPENPDSSF